MNLLTKLRIMFIVTGAVMFEFGFLVGYMTAR